MRFLVNRKKESKTGSQLGDKRLLWMRRVFVIMAALMILKLFFIQIIRGGYYEALASGQHELYKTLFPQRGQILVHDSDSVTGVENLFPLATNKVYKTLYADPRLVTDPRSAAEKLSLILEMTADELLLKLDKPHDPYEVLKRKLDDAKIAEITALNISGLAFQDETYRFYPEKNIGANVLGFVGIRDDKKVGVYGAEGYFNELLTGKIGDVKSDRDLAGRWITSTDRTFHPAEDGADVILTLDRVIQYEACKALNDGVEKYDADGGTIVIMEPYSGKILAMCSNPDFNPNDYSKVEDIRAYNNTAIFDTYEPGSIFKPITMAAALDQNVVTPDTTYIDTGEVHYENFTIRNSDKLAHGKTSMIEVLNKSLNTGMIFVVQKLGGDNFRRYLENFGFGEPVGITLNSEVGGNISSLKKKAEIYAYTAAFGQGITVTPLQMVQGFSAIANGGYLVKPYILDEIRGNGYSEKTQTKVIRKVLDQRSAILVSGMMASVIKYGFGKLAQVPGYTVAGKTGTAQIAEDGSYGNKTNHSFIGFAPVDNPAFVMLVKYENPRKGSFAESTAAPTFGQVASFLLKYLKVPPDEK